MKSEFIISIEAEPEAINVFWQCIVDLWSEFNPDELSDAYEMSIERYDENT